MNKVFGVSLKSLKRGIVMACFLHMVNTLPVHAQSISVNTIQQLSFGAFYLGNSGGTITVSAQGIRSATGDVIPMNMGDLYNPAMLEITAPQGTMITLLNGPDVELTGSNGGTMKLKIGDSDPVSPFSIPVGSSGKTQVSIGGTLIVDKPEISKAGTYTGSFSITIIEQ